MKKRINFFVSYSHKNRELALEFSEKLLDNLKPSKQFQYSVWSDNELVLGEEWEAQILSARDSCDLGLLLLSPAFLGSKFICDKELPHFIGSSRAQSVPVMLQPVDLNLHDLRGLDHLQIFRYQGPKFSRARAYGECKPKARDQFVLELFRKIEAKLSK
jgi:hypothetical protein